jgi:hypothetical protein
LEVKRPELEALLPAVPAVHVATKLTNERRPLRHHLDTIAIKLLDGGEHPAMILDENTVMGCGPV